MNSMQIKAEKNRINKLVEDQEQKKASLLLEIGKITYQKIREKSIDSYGFEELCLSIKEIDELIYENNIKRDDLESKNSKEVCECGEICSYGSKFCSSCGAELNRYKIRKIICEYCKKEIDSDSNFCVCCGNKVDLDNKVKDNIYIEKYEVIEE